MPEVTHASGPDRPYHAAHMTLAAQPARLHADLIAMLRATREAERELFALLDAATRDAGATIGSWSAKDVQGHLAAWRGIEARRLLAAAGDPPAVDDPAIDAPVDASNASLQAARAGWSWEDFEREADASVEALIAAIERSSTEALCACADDIVGIGANGVNHAVAHLGDVAILAAVNPGVGAAASASAFDRFLREVEAVLRHSHLPPRDSSVILYNAACHRALTGELEEARRLLRAAFGLRSDLADAARDDPDLVALAGEIEALGAASRDPR